eukprot:6187438-Pleurochrysis_carterae.AAC.2
MSRALPGHASALCIPGDEGASAAVGALVVLLAALLGSGSALSYSTLLACASSLADPSWRSSALGVVRFWRDLGYAVGGLVLGAAVDGARGGVWAAAAVGCLLSCVAAAAFAAVYSEARMVHVMDGGDGCADGRGDGGGDGRGDGGGDGGGSGPGGSGAAAACRNRGGVGGRCSDRVRDVSAGIACCDGEDAGAVDSCAAQSSATGGVCAHANAGGRGGRARVGDCEAERG